MPPGSIEAVYLDIGEDDGRCRHRLAFEADAERVAHEAVPAVTTNQVVGAHAVDAGSLPERRGHAAGVLIEGSDRRPELDLRAQFFEPRAQNLLGAPLRHHPQIRE